MFAAFVQIIVNLGVLKVEDVAVLNQSMFVIRIIKID